MIERIVCVAILVVGIGTYLYGRRKPASWCGRYLTVKRRPPEA